MWSVLLYFAHGSVSCHHRRHTSWAIMVDLVVRLNNGKEVVESRDDVLIYD
jgi:hypothetical protein